MALGELWTESFPDRSRPKLYSSDEPVDGFLPLTDVDNFLVDSLQSLTTAQLYALTANNAEALVQAQQEWTRLERLATQIRNRDPLAATVKDPQELPRRDIFEERKEAILYGYKYEANRRMLPARFTVSENVTDQEKFDCREPPEPFAQGGFIPNDKQYKSLMTAAKNEGREKNPDNQKPYRTNFAFHDRPDGTWIAKMLQPEAPPPPRTRAREAALNGTATASDRATRFNGERFPPTRGVSLEPSNTASPGKRTATPVGGASPASKKRKIETVDITNGLPKKKHPNQYTRRREIEMASQLAAAQEYARTNGLPVPEHYTQLEPMSAPASPVPDKKHPNQYTKRREREEADRLVREEAQRLQYGQGMPLPPPPPPPYGYPYPSYDRGYGIPPPPFDPGHSAYPLQGPPPKSKQPNQYTKQREREEADRFAAMRNANSTAAAFAGQRLGTPTAYARFPPQQYGPPPVFDTRPTSSRPDTPSQPVGRDTSRMTADEKRKHPFKDHELIADLERDHLWLHDDPERAAAWKAKIMQSDYPVRTWAMLRKWREWRAEGKDKRPRDKDGNKTREPAAVRTTNGTATRDEDAEKADVESAAPSQPVSEDTISVNVPTVTAARAMSPMRRPIRLRTRASGLDSPSAGPGSPLVNGINVRDLNTLDTPPSSLSFSSKLRGVGELDSTTKVDTWQEKNQTDYAASTATGKGALRQHPRFQLRGTEDELYPSSAEPEHSLERTSADQDYHDVEAESEDLLHDSISETSRSSSPPTDPGEQDATYRGGARNLPRRSALNGGEEMRRTRSAVSAISNGTPDSPKNTRATRARSSYAKASTITVNTERDRTNSPLTRKLTRGSSHLSNTITVANGPSEDEDEDEDEDEHEHEDRAGEPEKAVSLVIGRRSLRPNPPKRTFTADSNMSSTAPIITRRSLRNSGRVEPTYPTGRRGSD